MSMQRTNPLPIGRYEKDVFGDQVETFANWLQSHAETILEEHAEFIPPLTSGVHYKFYVFTPTQWDGPGYPDISDDKSEAPVWPYHDSPGKMAEDAAEAAKKTAGDVVEAAEAGASAVKTGLVIGGLGLLAWLLGRVLG